MEQGPVAETMAGTLGELFDQQQLLTDVSGSGNNWAHGHCVYGPKYREQLQDKLHRAVELCDSLQSFFVMHSMGGGTGSGLGTYILGLLEDQYPDVYRFATVVFPSEDDDVVTSPYNSMLALRELTEHADCVLPIENEALMDLCAKIQRGTSSEQTHTHVVDGSRLTDSVDLRELEKFYKSGKGPPVAAARQAKKKGGLHEVRGISERGPERDHDQPGAVPQAALPAVEYEPGLRNVRPEAAAPPPQPNVLRGISKTVYGTESSARSSQLFRVDFQGVRRKVLSSTALLTLRARPNMARLGDPSVKDMVLRLSRSSRSQYEHERTSEYEQQHSEESKERTAALENIFVGIGSPSETRAHLKVGDTSTDTESPVVNIWDRRWCGLVLHSITIGLVSTVLPLCVYPFLTCNLNMEGTQTLSARTLLGLPWALKPIFALFIHCSPLPRGFRLRSAMTIGWGATASALIAIFFRDQPTPYFQDRKMVGTPLSDLSTQQMNSINLDAPAHGAFYVMLMCVASVGFVLADVAADELIRDVAVHHFGVSASPRDEDEVFQPVMTKYRVIATLGCFLFMGFGMSGWDYGGDFDFSLEYTQVMLVVGLVSLLPVVLLGFTVSETARDRRSLRQSLREIWSLVHNCGLNHVLLCRFVGGVCAGVSATAVNPIAFYYAGVQPLNDTVVSFVAIIVVLWALNWVGKKDWNVDYRTVIVVGTIITLVLDCGATMFTIWGVVRSQWFWIGLPVMEAIPSALDYTISTVVLTEIADARAYSSMSALVTRHHDRHDTCARSHHGDVFHRVRITTDLADVAAGFTERQKRSTGGQAA
ncbi:hypothetical protein ON010_g13586 [Phytophthora cinnamomi]|nr:hypothetical protein ON010_g13586 [Phytophthora cinnamomi]